MTNPTLAAPPANEYVSDGSSGWPMLFINLAMYPGTFLVFIYSAYMVNHGYGAIGGPGILLAACLFISSILVSKGFLTLQPNEAAVLLLFGTYRGTIKTEGFRWINPFFTKTKISLRLRNLNGDRLKVNDKSGNPIEIAAVIVWRVEDTYAASFEVDDYNYFVKIQSESALRHLASSYHYDAWDEHEKELSLRGSIDEVSLTLENELQQRLHKAGVVVSEARLSHLAYASEIAEAMLRRQQASAIIAARTKIVEGAVSMVKMALDHLREQNIVEFDNDRKVALVSNLLVVLCSEHHAQPVVNTGESSARSN